MFLTCLDSFFLFPGGAKMEEVKVIRTVYVDNKLKRIYKEYEGYISLSEEKTGEALQDFFDQIFLMIWTSRDGILHDSNKEIGRALGYKESTIEKKMRALERHDLIYRKVSRYMEDNRWKSKRDTTLNPGLISLMMKGLKLLPKHIAAIAEKEEPKASKKNDVFYAPKDEEPEAPQFVYKKVKRR